jgi:hypothetical protein
MVTIQDDSTARAVVHTLGEQLGLPVSTLRAVLTRIGRAHSHQRLPSICCFVSEVCGKLRPRGIDNTLGQTVVMHHPVHGQVFNSDDSKPLDQAAAFLVRKVVASIGDALMHAGNNRAALRSFNRAFGGRRQLPLGALQVFLIGPQKLGAWGLLASRKRVEARQSYVNAYGRASLPQGALLYVADNGDVPFACRAAPYRTGLGGAVEGAMLDNPQCADLGEVQRAFGQLTPIAVLWEGHRVVAALPSETGIAGLFACFTPAKERLKGQVNAHGNILQDLRMNVAQSCSFLLQRWQCCGLLVVGQRRLPLCPGRFALGKEMVVQPAAFLKLAVQLFGLRFGRLESVFHRFKHGKEYRLIWEREQAFSSPSKGLKGPFLYPQA